MDYDDGTLWWNTLSHDLGLGNLFDDIEKEFDPYRGRVEEGIEIVKDINKAYENINPRNQRNDKGKLRGSQKKTIEKKNMGLEDININKIKNNVSDNIMHRRINTGMSKATGQESTTDEVPVMPVPNRVSKIAPDYFNIRLPIGYTASVTSSTTIGIGDTIGGSYIKLNSFLNPVLGATVDGRGSSHWSVLFDYYRVTRCDVSITFFNQNISSTDYALVGWHLSDKSSPTGWSTQRDMLESKHGGSKVLAPFNLSGERQTLSYSYTPGSWDHHVTESGIEERWTPVLSDPADPRYFHFGIVRGPHVPTAGQVSARYIMKITQHIQFREVGEATLDDEDN